jgi:hypothetical protein
MLNKSIPALLVVAVMVVASPPRCAGGEVALFYAPNLALGGLNGLGEAGPLGVKARVTVAESGALRLNAGVGYGLYQYRSKHVYYLIWDRVGERGFVAGGAIAKLLGIRGEYAVSVLRGGVALIKRGRNYTVKRGAVPAAINHIRERLERTYVRRRTRERKAK